MDMEGNDKTCRHIKADGRPCDALRLHGSEYCFFHDPAKAAERAAAQRSGGQNGRAAVLPADTPMLTVKTASDVVGLLSETINQVRVGTLDARIGNCVGYLAGIVLKAVEQGDMEERLAALEGIVASQDPPRRAFDTDPDELVIEDEDRKQPTPRRATA